VVSPGCRFWEDGVFVPPRPVLKAPSPWLPGSPTRTTSPSTYGVLSGLMLPAPPRPWETSGADIVGLLTQISDVFGAKATEWLYRGPWEEFV
jgi:hypothetical protein